MGLSDLFVFGVIFCFKLGQFEGRDDVWEMIQVFFRYEWGKKGV